MPATRYCSECGTAVQPDGLCPRCLLLAAAAPPTAGAPPKPRELPAPAELAALFPGFEIGELLGQGGMGLVYRARQRGLDRQVALKLLAREIAAEPGFAERFTREARVLASLAHPHIVQVFEFGQQGPWFYFAMELVEGASLREMLRARSLAARESLAIVAQICDALQYAHDRGVVHRDIKPENVLVDRSGQVKILDFGLSKVSGARPGDTLTRTDQVMGTPHYMAPEQWERPSEVDHRADIYALGVVFYELLTGELPLGRFEPPSKKVVIDVRLDDVVLRTLAKEPERRYQHASEVRTDVEHVAVSMPPPLPAAPPRAAPAEPIPTTRGRELVSALQRRPPQLLPARSPEPFPLALKIALAFAVFLICGGAVFTGLLFFS
ncbi:MAG: serine/threonine protein kinase [Planctomycetota bacterium]|nr:MAG: serine/threonine protein kinase [Planctomycetota bacterium]